MGIGDVKSICQKMYAASNTNKIPSLSAIWQILKT